MQRAVTAAVILALALGTVAASAADEEEPATGAFSRTGSIAHAPFAPLVWEAAALPDLVRLRQVVKRQDVADGGP